MKKILSSVLVAGMLLGVGATASFTIGGASGAKTDWQTQGKLGAVKLNPYGLTPLTAIIMNNGYILNDVSVKVLPKNNGQTINYKVDNQILKTYGGIPILAFIQHIKIKLK